MNTKSYFLPAAALLLAAGSTGCSDNLDSLVSNAENTVIIAYCGGDNCNSRSAINPNEYLNGDIGILWTPDDHIGVFSESSKNANFRNTETSSKGRAVFSGELAGIPLCAYYPYSDNAGDDYNNLSGYLPLQQTMRADEDVIDGDYKIGTHREGSEYEFQFSHIFSLLKVTIDATDTEIEDQRLRKLTIEAPSGRWLGGNFTFSAIDGNYKANPTDDSNILTLDWENPQLLKSGASIYGFLSCASELKSGDKLTFTLLTDTHTAVFSAEVTMDFYPNNLYNINIPLKDHNPSIEAIPEEETANCYMITVVGEHDFKATVIGNGQKGIIPGAGFHTEDASIDPKSAKLIWEDVEGFISDVTLSEGRVHYRANKNIGNALIAVYSGENCSGDILWSWHIWGVGDSLPLDYTVTTKVNGNEFMVMDRNLGALPVTEEMILQSTKTEDVETEVLRSMLYQWGRKDPFPNAPTYYVNGEPIDITSSYPLFEATSDEEASILTSIRNPDKLMKYGTTSDWYSSSQNGELLWGDNLKSSDSDTGDWTNVKTIYDPSPVGYRIPGYYTWTGVNTKSNNSYKVTFTGQMSSSNGVPNVTELNCVISEQQTSSGTTRYLPKGIHLDVIGTDYTGSKKMCGYGLFFKRFADDTVGCFYPQCGSRDATSGGRADYGVSSKYWLSCYKSAAGSFKQSCLSITHFAWKNSSGTTGTNSGFPTGNAGVVGTVDSQSTGQSRQAYSVRCVRE